MNRLIECGNFKIGDKIKITNCINGHGYNMGEIVTLIYIGEYNVRAINDSGKSCAMDGREFISAEIPNWDK